MLTLGFLDTKPFLENHVDFWLLWSSPFYYYNSRERTAKKYKWKKACYPMINKNPAIYVLLQSYIMKNEKNVIDKYDPCIAKRGHGHGDGVEKYDPDSGEFILKAHTN